MTSLPPHLKLGIAIFPEVTQLDWTGPLEVLATLRPTGPAAGKHDISITTTLLAESMSPVRMSGDYDVLPQMTFDDAKGREWDAILVPGGQGARPWKESNAAAQQFIKDVFDELKVLLTVCTGSWLVAHTGMLAGYKATTNKASYKEAKEHTADKGVEWIPKARWVVDRKVWASSGVTAGIDMTSAFIKHFLSVHLAAEEAQTVHKQLIGRLEVVANEQDEDPWAEYFEL